MAKPWLLWNEQRLRRNLGLYVHIPFCLKRCVYCAFLTFDEHRPPGLTPANYVEELLKEIRLRGAWAHEQYGKHGRVVDSVFIGGGTPTFLESDVLAEIVSALKEHFPFATEGFEITTEANPDTLHNRSLEKIAASGVNRISAGVQATQEHHLRFLSRTHRWKDIEPVLASFRGGPIERFNYDLIYALPGMTVGEVRESVKRLLRFDPGHLSCYELTIEPGTPYQRWTKQFPTRLASPEQAEEQQQAIARICADHGYYRYEVSNYAKPGHECRHNLRYWRGGDYIGMGLGSASRIGSEVINNPRGLPEYREQNASIGSPEDPLHSALAERNGNGSGTAELAPPADSFLRLRTPLGIPRTDQFIEARWLQRGLLRPTNGRLEVSRKGMSFADYFALRME